MPRPRAESVVVGVTGASGAVYARRLLEVVLEQVPEVHLTVSSRGLQLLNYELGLHLRMDAFDSEQLLGRRPENLRFWSPDDMNAPFASGSAACDAMVIVPCTMSKIGAIAAGYCDDLISRGADVALKEGRTLIVVPRETPLNLLHLRRLTALCEAGATIMPAMPSYYRSPETIADLVDSVVYRIADHLGLIVPDSSRWAGEQG